MTTEPDSTVLQMGRKKASIFQLLLIPAGDRGARFVDDLGVLGSGDTE